MKKETTMALAKVLIAAAWADGELTHDEINSLKDLLFSLPNMTADDYASLEIYLDSPISEEESARLVENLRKTLANPKERSFAIETLEKMVSADGKETDTEQAFLEEVSTELEAGGFGLMKALSGMLHGTMNRRSETVEESPNRESQTEYFLKNKIFFDINQKIAKGDVDFSNISEDKLRKLSLASGLMARVAYVDDKVAAGEREGIQNALLKNWGLTQSEASFVTEIALSEFAKGMDNYRLSRQFFESTTEDERVNFLDVLFAVAASDGEISYYETEEIRQIAKGLLLSHDQFINAKLKATKKS
jgi:uncharacterized tellurite resistance protein B-like protein